MPAAFAHLYFGSLVLDSLEPGLQKRLREKRNLFRIGVQGPDLLFFYNPLKKNPVNAIGYCMHGQKADSFFDSCRSIVEQSPDKEAALAYVIGFICHFTLDSECHGYIAQAMENTGVTHSELETELDKYLMKNLHLDPLRFEATAGMKATSSTAGVIAPFFGIDPGKITVSILSMKCFRTILRTVHGIPRKMIFLILKAAGGYESIAGMFLNMEDNPLCEESNRKLSKLLKNAVGTAGMLIQSYLGYMEQKNTLSERFERNYE